MHKLLKRPKTNLGLSLCIVSINVNGFFWAQFLLMLMRSLIQEKKRKGKKIRKLISICFKYFLMQAGNDYLITKYTDSKGKELFTFYFCFHYVLAFLKLYIQESYRKIQPYQLYQQYQLFIQPKISHILYIRKKRKDFSVICRIAPVTTT